MSHRLPPGKVPWEIIADLVTGALPPDVELGPALGEDAALVTIGGETWAVASDPISFTAADAGRLAVLVNANDVAVRGARPRFFLAVALIAPRDADAKRIQALLRQVREACAEVGAVLVGGHTEVAPGLTHSLIVGTMLGRVEGHPVTSGGLRSGDVVGLTRSAGLEGTAILLAEHGERLRRLPDFPAGSGPEGSPLSVVEEALILARCRGVSALHDVTEGGVGEALHELAMASGITVRADRSAVPVSPVTDFVCRQLGLDPLGLIGSGALLLGCTAEAADDAEAALARLDVPVTWIGRAERTEEEPGSTLPRFPRDELLKSTLMASIRAVVFDMDGTLVASTYDWPTIRRDLGVTGGSIIDELNGLAEPERRRRWSELEAIEATATDRASVHDGAADLLELLAEHGLATALVTNNSAANADRLLERFGLRFDVVLTRDSGMWKPSGAPLAEAARRLGVPPEHCLGVGDSHYDLLAGREAGFAAVCMVHEGAAQHDHEADLSFDHIPAFIRYLSVVLA